MGGMAYLDGLLEGHDSFWSRGGEKLVLEKRLCRKVSGLEAKLTVKEV